MSVGVSSVVARSAQVVAPAPAEARPRVTCAHCGLDVPAGLTSSGEPLQFCCDGCRQVYSTIHSCGLDQYYAIRARVGAEGRRARAADATLAEFDDPAFLQVYSRPADANAGGEISPTPAALRVDLLLEGVHCAACLWLVERLPRIVPGVRSARLDLRRAVVTLEWEPARVRLSAVAGTLARLGYRPHALTDTSATQARRRQDRAYLIRIGVAAACAGNAMLLAIALYGGDLDGMHPVYAMAFRWLSAALGLASLLWPGRIFLDGAIAALRARLWHLDMPIAIALVVGNLAGILAAVRGTDTLFADSLTMLVFLLLVGRWLQLRQQRHALDAVELLFSLTPGVAHLVDENATVGACPGPQDSVPTRDVAVQSLQRGQIVQVRAQEAFPVDGVIVSGMTSVDDSILTGESRPRPAESGDPVVAGAVNLSTPVLVRALAVGRETRAGRMMGTIEELSRRRTPIVGSAQMLAAPFVLVVLALAAITLAVHAGAGFETALSHAIALLVATCPCAIALATPLVVTIAVGRAAEGGVLVKGGDVFERLSRPGTILLDKTGTVTTGRFRVLEWHGDATLRPVVAKVERGSNHPVAVALASRGSGDQLGGCVAGDELTPSDRQRDWHVEHVLGRGVVATRPAEDWREQALRIGSPAWISSLGIDVPRWATDSIALATSRAHTPVLIADAGSVRALAVLGDEIREDARHAVGLLQRAGWRVGLLSGDDPRVVGSVATALGIDPSLAWGGVSPEGKLERVRAIQAEADHRHAGASASVVMVGDGVNDAGALAAAGVGIAVHGGAEASLAAADVYVERAGLLPVVELASASRRVTRTIRLCLAIAIAYNLLAAGLAVGGLLSPLVAAAMMPVSSLSILTIAVRARSFEGGGARQRRRAAGHLRGGDA